MRTALFVNRENIKNFKKRLETETDDAKGKTLLSLLAEEVAKAEQFSRSTSLQKAQQAQTKLKTQVLRKLPLG